MSDERPDPVPIDDGHASRRFSFVWLIPILAILAALGVAWQTYAERGPLIEVTFSQASGVRPQETELRYRDIPVGIVETVRFSGDLSEVILGIRVDQSVASFVDDEAQFWIVRPEVSAQGVSGLDTVLSGVYISGAWDETPGTPQTRFAGAPNTPLLALGERGVTFTLRSEDGLPAEGTPILYRGVEVGKVGRTDLSPDGLFAEASAVVREPYAGRITTATRFWDISGFGFSLGAQGASLNFTSLASLISGGVTFETLSSGGQPLTEDELFTLHPDEETAREDFLIDSEQGTVELAMIFEENLAGLQAGAGVSLGGVRLGEVLSLSGLVDAERFGDTRARLLATMRLNPARLGLTIGDSDTAFLDYLAGRVEEGLRGQLTNASLLTGGLMIDLVDVPDAPPAVLDRDGVPYPLFPTTAANVTNLQATAQGLLARVDALPIEELLQSTITTLRAARDLIASDDLQAAPESILATLDAVRGIAEAEEIAALPALIGTLAEDLTTASATLTALLEEVETRAILAGVADLVESLGTTADTLPALAEEASSLLASLDALPADEIAGRVSGLLARADTLLSDGDLAALPSDLRTSLSNLDALVTNDALAALPGQVGTLTTGLQETTGQINTLLTDLREEAVVARLAEVVDALGQTADRLPGLADQAENVLSDAEALSLDELSAEARRLLASIDAVVAQESVRALPETVDAALSALRETLDDLREGGAIENTNATLAAAREAAEAVSEASTTLPALAERLNGVALRADSTLAGYARGSDFNRDLAQAIRQIEAAASAIDRLARQIARDPNSLLTGR